MEDRAQQEESKTDRSQPPLLRRVGLAERIANYPEVVDESLGGLASQPDRLAPDQRLEDLPLLQIGQLMCRQLQPSSAGGLDVPGTAGSILRAPIFEERTLRAPTWRRHTVAARIWRGPT